MESHRDGYVETSSVLFPPCDAGKDAPFLASPSGRRLWTGTLIVEVASGKVLAELDRSGLEFPESQKCAKWVGEDQVYEVVSFSTKRQKSGDRTATHGVVVWGLAESKPRRFLSAENATALSLSADGRQLAEAGNDGIVRIRETANFAVVQQFRASHRALLDIAWNPRFPVFAIASADLTIRLWNADTHEIIEELGLQNPAFRELEWSPDGRSLAAKREDLRAPGSYTSIFHPTSPEQQALR
jgi:WD40 repeat protein